MKRYVIKIRTSMLLKQPYPQQCLSTVKYFILDLFLDVLARGDDTKQTAFTIDSNHVPARPPCSLSGAWGAVPPGPHSPGKSPAVRKGPAPQALPWGHHAGAAAGAFVLFAGPTRWASDQQGPRPDCVPPGATSRPLICVVAGLARGESLRMRTFPALPCYPRKILVRLSLALVFPAQMAASPPLQRRDPAAKPRTSRDAAPSRQPGSTHACSARLMTLIPRADGGRPESLLRTRGLCSAALAPGPPSQPSLRPGGKEVSCLASTTARPCAGQPLCCSCGKC